MIDWESESLVDDHAGRSPGPAARALIEKQRTVLEWYEHRSRGHGRDDAWPEGAVVVIEGGFAPLADDLTRLRCRCVATRTQAELNAGLVDDVIPPTVAYVLIVVGQDFSLDAASGIMRFEERLGLPVGVLPAKSPAELTFMMRRMALARRMTSGRHVVIDAADSATVIGDLSSLSDPAGGGTRSLSVYGHGNESHLKVGKTFLCSHSASRFPGPGQDCACADHGLRLCRLDEVRCAWIHLGSCGAMVPDWRRSVPAGNFVDSFASSYAATVCGSLYRMPTSRSTIIGRELEQLGYEGALTYRTAGYSAGTICLGDPVLLKHSRDVANRAETITRLRGELADVELDLARLNTDQERLAAVARAVEDAREKVNFLRLSGGPAAREVLGRCMKRVNEAAGWVTRAAARLSAAREREVYAAPGRAETRRCLGHVNLLGCEFEQELVRFAVVACESSARGIERAMKSGITLGSERSSKLCDCHLCGRPVYVVPATGVASGRDYFWAYCDVCGQLSRSPDGVRFPLISLVRPGAVGVKFYATEAQGTIEAGAHAESSRAIVDVDDGMARVHLTRVLEVPGDGVAFAGCEAETPGPSVRVRALVVSGFSVWFARATVPSAALVGSQ